MHAYFIILHRLWLIYSHFITLKDCVCVFLRVWEQNDGENTYINNHIYIKLEEEIRSQHTHAAFKVLFTSQRELLIYCGSHCVHVCLSCWQHMTGVVDVSGSGRFWSLTSLTALGQNTKLACRSYKMRTESEPICCGRGWQYLGFTLRSLP